MKAKVNVLVKPHPYIFLHFSLSIHEVPSLGSSFAVLFWPSQLSSFPTSFTPSLLTHTHTLGPPGPTTGGVVYTRWGRTTCPNTTGTQLLYAGKAPGSYYNEKGGGANYLCLPEQPQYSFFTAGTQSGRAYLYGAEYQTINNANSPLHSLHDHNVPCAVCYTSTRETLLMIPARLTCPSSWTREYYGYLMAERYDHHRKTFECVDLVSFPDPPYDKRTRERGSGEYTTKFLNTAEFPW